MTCLELERGATNIQSYAYLVLDNNGQLSESVKRLVLFAEGKGSAPTRGGRRALYISSEAPACIGGWTPQVCRHPVAWRRGSYGGNMEVEPLCDRTWLGGFWQASCHEESWASQRLHEEKEDTHNRPGCTGGYLPRNYAPRASSCHFMSSRCGGINDHVLACIFFESSQFGIDPG